MFAVNTLQESHKLALTNFSVFDTGVATYDYLLLVGGGGGVALSHPPTDNRQSSVAMPLVLDTALLHMHVFSIAITWEYVTMQEWGNQICGCGLILAVVMRRVLTGSDVGLLQRIMAVFTRERITLWKMFRIAIQNVILTTCVHMHCKRLPNHNQDLHTAR